ncbi:hypothetical protein PENSPDRAFT_691620 [Peniophora sp. CONT]|nr:hypothetical protein PENSPDRAFT_691620 [Peniophora sp. CONT]
MSSEVTPDFLSTLPADVVIDIYQCLARIHKPMPRTEEPSYDLYPQEGTLGWAHLTHVCRNLRYIGINDIPALWADDLCTLPKAFSTFLARARNTPLHVIIRDLAENSNQFHEELTRILPQAGSFKLDMRTRFDQAWPVPSHARVTADKLLDVLRRDPPSRMTSMVLINVKAAGDSDIPAADQDPLQTPNLRHASVLGCFVPFRAPHLRTLEVRGCRYCHVADFCSLLRHLPLLEYLTWEAYSSEFGWNQAPGDDELAPLKPVQLPQLKSFHVVDQCANLSQLANALVCPDIGLTDSLLPRPIYIGFQHSREPWELVAGACTPFRTRLLPAYNTRSIKLTIPLTVRFVPRCHILLGDDWDPSMQVLAQTAHTIFGLHGTRETPSLATLIKGVAATIAPEIHSLHALGRIPLPPPPIDGDTYFGQPPDTNTMRDALLDLPNVKELHLAYSAEGILSLLQFPQEPANGSSLVFPVLETIVVDTTNPGAGWAKGMPDPGYYEGGEYYADWQAGHLPATWWSSFCVALSSRAAQGFKLRRLVLRGRICHFAELKSDEGLMPVEEGILHPIDLTDMSDWTDEVVDERVTCGLFEDDDHGSSYEECERDEP